MIKRGHLCFCLILCLSTVAGTSQEITYWPSLFGPDYYQDDVPIERAELSLLMEDVPVAHAAWRKSRTFNTLASITLSAEMGFLIWGLSDDGFDRAPLIGFSVSAVASTIFRLITNGFRKRAFLEYNHALDVSLNFGVTRDGMGIVMSF